MEELRRKLSNKYLTTGEYINHGLEVFKNTIIKEKILVAAIAGLTLFGSIIPFIGWIFTFMNTALSFILIRRIIGLIEENEYPDSKDEISKSVILTGIYFISVIAIGILIFIPMIIVIGLVAYLNHIIIMVLLIILLSIIAGVIMTFIYFYVVPYFIPVYMSRNVGIKEAYKINKELRTGNRMRLFIPLIIIIIIGISTLPLIAIPFIGILFVAVLGSIMGVLSSSIMTLVFLNVEYMDSNRENIPEQIFIEDKITTGSVESEKVEKNGSNNDIKINDDEV